MSHWRGTLTAALLGLVGCAAGLIPIDQVPMYGPMDRNAYPVLAAGDAAFIAACTATAGSHHAASETYVNFGDEYFAKGDLVVAMRRYNQAWLLEKENPNVYWRFAAVLLYRYEDCEGVRMIDLGASHGEIPSKFLPLAAVLHAGCGATKASDPSSAGPAEDFAAYESLIARAEADPSVPRGQILEARARFDFARGRYTESWEKVAEYRRVTGEEISEAFLGSLRAKMTEPLQ